MVKGTSRIRASVCASSVLPLDIGGFRCVVQPLVMVVDGDRQHPLGVRLADHVIVEHATDLARGRHAVAGLQTRGLG